MQAATEFDCINYPFWGSCGGQITQDHAIISNYVPLSALSDTFSSSGNDPSLQIMEYNVAMMWILKVDKPS